MSKKTEDTLDDKDILEKDPDYPTTDKRSVHSAPKSKASAADLVNEIGGHSQPNALGMERGSKFDDLKIRKVTLATLEMLRMVDSPLISGVEVDDSLELLPHCLEFLYLHCVSKDDAMDYALEDDSKKRKRIILSWTEQVEITDVGEFINHTMGILQEAVATQVEPKYPEDEDPTEEIDSGNR